MSAINCLRGTTLNATFKCRLIAGALTATIALILYACALHALCLLRLITYAPLLFFIFVCISEIDYYFFIPFFMPHIPMLSPRSRHYICAFTVSNLFAVALLLVCGLLFNRCYFLLLFVAALLAPFIWDRYRQYVCSIIINESSIWKHSFLRCFLERTFLFSLFVFVFSYFFLFTCLYVFALSHTLYTPRFAPEKCLACFVLGETSLLINRFDILS